MNEEQQRVVQAFTQAAGYPQWITTDLPGVYPPPVLIEYTWNQVPRYPPELGPARHTQVILPDGTVV